MKRIIVSFSILLLLVPFTASAQVDFCEGNFDYDSDQDSSDAATFKTDFSRSSMKNPCPGGFAPVPKTGQTTSYATGDDGDLERGVPSPNPRFTDNGNGTVTDNLTGLIWLKNANCFGMRLWDSALYDCNGLHSGQCGLTDGSQAGDWRLPNRFELESLLDLENIPALPTGHPFINVQPSVYWSSTTGAYYFILAWYVDMLGGGVARDGKVSDGYVWPVRGGQ